MNKIKCDVHECKYCDCKCNNCTLKEIKVCPHHEGAICDSYKKKDE